MSCTAVVRRSRLDSVGHFDEERALQGVDDWHLWLRMAPLTNFDLVERVLAYRTLHGDNYSANEKKMLEAERLCLKKIAPYA